LREEINTELKLNNIKEDVANLLKKESDKNRKRRKNRNYSVLSLNLFAVIIVITLCLFIVATFFYKIEKDNTFSLQQ
jgi:cytoskeletal protein RodZ